MTFGKQIPHINITMEGGSLTQVTNFKYLGVNLNNSDQEIEIKARIESTARTYQSIKGTLLIKRRSQQG